MGAMCPPSARRARRGGRMSGPRWLRAAGGGGRFGARWGRFGAGPAAVQGAGNAARLPPPSRSRGGLDRGGIGGAAAAGDHEGPRAHASPTWAARPTACAGHRCSPTATFCPPQIENRLHLRRSQRPQQLSRGCGCGQGRRLWPQSLARKFVAKPPVLWEHNDGGGGGGSLRSAAARGSPAAAGQNRRFGGGSLAALPAVSRRGSAPSGRCRRCTGSGAARRAAAFPAPRCAQ